MRIRRLGVVGAGTMGHGIAALAASAGIPVVLLDIPGPDTDRSAPARQGLEKAKKARPAAFMDIDRAALVRVGNTADDLKLLADCDLVIEAIIEQLEPKRALYAELEKVLGAHTIIASNTSGIPMALLTKGRSDGFTRRFVGMHFFNPPRYLHLLEIIPTAHTAPETISAVRAFSERVLGKGIVTARDVPGFVANRLGVFGMILGVRMMEEFKLSIDEVDVLTGPLIGRAKSATFRTADLTGLDVLAHVATGLSQATGEDFALPPWVDGMIRNGQLGEKSGAGFYKRVGKEIHTLDWTTMQYAPAKKPESKAIDAALRMPLAERLAAAVKLDGTYGEFVRQYLARLSQYVVQTAPKIAYHLGDVDHAMEWGFAWEAGPFRQLDLLGDALPGTTSMRPAPAADGYYSADGMRAMALDWSGYEPVQERDDLVRIDRLKRAGRALYENADATLWHAGDGVAVLEFHSKMNSLGEGVITMLQRALEIVDRDALAGLVIGNDDPRTFTAGADLGMIAALVQAGDWKRLDEAVRLFQGCSMAIRSAPFPVVAAPFGLTLGGGCEWSLHAAAIQAHAELYMGLVEAGVGLLPGGGGTKELLFRFAGELAPYDDADPFEAPKRAFKLIAMAATSTSALEARKLGFLRAADRISMNRDLLLTDAKQRVLDLAPGYVAPPPRTIMAVGRDGIGNLDYAAWAMREAGQASDYDLRLAHEIACVLCGGDGPARIVTEQDILDLERDAFLRLLGNQETQERIVHMLKTGKPLRN
ncbi:MAG TPA: 3-hydroxyacyl-CoA dehydrogenase/enoyl-CoA hydratase family protein [Gemmatimonadaceae bacterium]|nr:3-hydroxyacyl-CoA dehydrogenase/enoyl-CoA hydratase family protein [Gemmatimonadaceae bacterium]